MKNIFTIITSFLFLLNINAQDAHFSQMDLNSTMRNPATLGSMEYDIKLSGSYRSQWSAIPSAYRNISLAYEQKISALSWGMSMLHNDAGKASMRTSHLLLNFSYQKKLSDRGEILAIGASGGVIQQRFQPELFSFDNQYVAGEGFDNSLSSGEQFVKTNQMLPSVGIGVFVSKYFNRIKGSAGLSFAHLNEPASTFFINQKEVYPRRTSIFADAQIPFNDKLNGTVRVAMNKQSVANEKIIGAKVNYKLANLNEVTAGISKRINDAFILEAGMEFQNTKVTVSYDMNDSKLSSVTNSKGALELSMTYCFNKKKTKQQPKVITPFPSNEVALQEKDSDGDGIVNNLDECPTVPGLRHFNGCNDTDRDGVWDCKDACPHLYGELNNQGCPVNGKDSDKDGLIDEIDKCPFLKGTAKMGGCPDSDKDGISDLEDYCPFLKGEKATNGCPNMNKNEHQEFIKNKSIKAVVEFDTDEAIIKEYFFDELDEVVEFLLENPKAEAFLSGHTDDEGNHEYNYKLSEKRSQVVKAYLMENGIAPSRISIVSYGETKPKLRNSSSYEKAKNRRVEIIVYLK